LSGFKQWRHYGIHSLTREPTGIKSPKLHEEILSDRKEKIESGNANFISLEELKSKHAK